MHWYWHHIVPAGYRFLFLFAFYIFFLLLSFRCWRYWPAHLCTSFCIFFSFPDQSIFSSFYLFYCIRYLFSFPFWIFVDADRCSSLFLYLCTSSFYPSFSFSSRRREGVQVAGQSVEWRGPVNSMIIGICSRSIWCFCIFCSWSTTYWHGIIIQRTGKKHLNDDILHHGRSQAMIDLTYMASFCQWHPESIFYLAVSDPSQMTDWPTSMATSATSLLRTRSPDRWIRMA